MKNKELTKAAQHADGLLQHYIHGGSEYRKPAESAIDNARALTQRPAAQTEQGAFETADDWLKATGRTEQAGCTAAQLNLSRIGFNAARASLPATQQATPEPGLLKTFLAEADRAGITHLPATFGADLAAATPEPVGEVVAWLYTEDGETKFGHPQGHRPKDARPLVFGDVRPAPGVPDGWRDVIAGTLKTDPWDSARVADYNSGWNDCQRKTLRGLERLAAAQAKGGEHG